MQKIQKIFYSLVAVFGLFLTNIFQKVFAQQSVPSDILPTKVAKWSIELPEVTGGDGLITILAAFQRILLSVVLPVVAVGSTIYIAYELLTAEGDDSKMKRAWRHIAYSIVAIISIALSAYIVNLISSINI